MKMHEPTERTGYRWLTCQVRMILDTDVVDGKVVTQRRYAADVSDSGSARVSIVADTPAEAFRKVAMYLEAEGMTL